MALSQLVKLVYKMPLSDATSREKFNLLPNWNVKNYTLRFDNGYECSYVDYAFDATLKKLLVYVSKET